MRRCLAVLALIAIACAAVPGPAVMGQDAPLFKSNVNLVAFPATVTDSSGRQVRDLRKEDLTVLEDGVRQQIAVFHFEPEPVSVGIVFDTSGSMRPKIQDVASAVSHFGATAQPDDDIFLMRFSGVIRVVLDSTSDRAQLTEAVHDLRAVGATALYDAVSEALNKVSKGRHRKRALLVITDGEDTSSDIKLNQLLEQARAAEVLVYCIGIGEAAVHRENHDSRPPNSVKLGTLILGGLLGHRKPTPQGPSDTVDMTVLNQLAEAGGARAWLVHDGELSKIDELIQEISNELRQQYFIGYYSSNPAHDGSYRRIEVSTSSPDYKVRARRGYYAAKGNE